MRINEHPPFPGISFSEDRGGSGPHWNGAILCGEVSDGTQGRGPDDSGVIMEDNSWHRLHPLIDDIRGHVKGARKIIDAISIGLLFVMTASMSWLAISMIF